MTDKWADYARVGEKYNEGHEHIVEVKMREDTGEKLTNQDTFSRRTVIGIIDSGKKIITAYLKDGKWQKGDKVGIVTVRGNKYIRTDGNSIDKDNLGELPEY